MGRNLWLIVVAGVAIVALAMGLTGSYAMVWKQLRSLGGAQPRMTQAQLAQLQAQVQALQSHPLGGGGASHG
jgi:hypothetical protein